MKKLFLVLSCSFTICLFSCNSNQAAPEESTPTQEQTAPEENNHDEVVNDETSQMKDHVCNDQCTPEKCHFVCGEKGHECSAECHAKQEDTES